MEASSDKNFTPINIDTFDTSAHTEQNTKVRNRKNLFIVLAVTSAVFLLSFIGVAFSKSAHSSKIAQTPKPTEKEVSIVPTSELSGLNDTPTSTKALHPTMTKPPITSPTKVLTATPIPPTSTPNPTNTPVPAYTITPTPIPPDTEPPQTNILTPQNGGEMTYTYPDRGYCVIATAPTDNRDRWQQIQTQFHFDSESYSAYATERAYMCVSFLPNGPHTFTYRSKDSSGNEEVERTISFTVNIPGK
jgi:cytoskeletal protein RodZ